ncbi:MAG: hypothetical protein ACRDCE_17670, partial [Cetobacterium sp.]|uniref:hypothetical protein n=1 Tax=Cetobacterium sp. TaxID=2071632 RepID=UPI003EE45B0B
GDPKFFNYITDRPALISLILYETHCGVRYSKSKQSLVNNYIFININKLLSPNKYFIIYYF